MNTSTLLKLALAGGVLFLLAKKVSAATPNPCAGRDDWEPCPGGLNRKCLKGQCIEFVRCADDPNCRNASVSFMDQVSTWLDPSTWLSLDAWVERFSESFNAAAETVMGEPDPDAITSTTDPRLDE